MCLTRVCFINVKPNEGQTGSNGAWVLAVDCSWYSDRCVNGCRPHFEENDWIFIGSVRSTVPLKSLLTGNNDWDFAAAQRAGAASYHLQRTLSVMTAVGRNRQVWVTPSPVTAETRGTDETHCDRSLTSNCCNHLTPPRPSPHVCTEWRGVVLHSSSLLS